MFWTCSVTWKHSQRCHTLKLRVRCRLCFNRAAAGVRLCVSACVCVCYVCLLSMDSTELRTWKKDRAEGILLPALQYRQQRGRGNWNQACSSALYCGWILMFWLWISERALKSALLSYSSLRSSSPTFFLFFHPLSLPPFSLSLSLSPSCTHARTHTLCFHSKVGILRVLTITLPPPTPPSSAPLSLPIFPVA